MKCVTGFGTYDVNIHKTSYCNNGALAITLDSPTEGQFATLTVNLGEFAEGLTEGLAFVDTNNCPWAEAFIEEHGLGKFTGYFGRSGYCRYPLYEFDLSKLGEE